MNCETEDTQGWEGVRQARGQGGEGVGNEQKEGLGAECKSTVCMSVVWIIRHLWTRRLRDTQINGQGATCVFIYGTGNRTIALTCIIINTAIFQHLPLPYLSVTAYSAQALYTILLPYFSPFFSTTMSFHSGTLMALTHRLGSTQNPALRPLAGAPSTAGTSMWRPV